MREYPKLPQDLKKPTKPISLICVKYSAEFEHNFAASECVRNDLNQVIVVDNRYNLFVDSLSQGLNSAITQATHDVIVIANEDVFFPAGWQAVFEQSLKHLQACDPDWRLAGCAGWDDDGKIHGYLNTAEGLETNLDDVNFAVVDRIDDALLILRKSNGIFPDPLLPGIRHVGRDLSLQAMQQSGKNYVLNAPVVQQYADDQGRLIDTMQDAVKLRLRNRLGYLTEKACSDEYMVQKWSVLDLISLDEQYPGPWGSARVPDLSVAEKITDSDRLLLLESPVILLAKGGGGSRLLSVLAEDLGLFIGNDVNPTGDSREMARSVYRGVIRKYRCFDSAQISKITHDLRATAVQLLEQGGWPQLWGFKVPESLFLLPELQLAFPNARFVYMRRDPLSTALRGTHMTAQYDNQIGQITLALAYDAAKQARQQILVDNDAIRLARTTCHQIDLLLDFKQQVASNRWLDLRFEALIENPATLLTDLAQFCAKPIKSHRVLQAFDKDRATIDYEAHSDETVHLVQTLLRPTRAKLGY